MTTTFKAVTSSAPCAVCEGTHKCSRGADGLFVCGRKFGPVQGFVFLGPAQGDTQFNLYRAEDDPILKDRDYHQANRQHNGTAHSQQNGTANIDWSAKAESFQRNLTPELRASLAKELGLPEAALSSLGIGYEHGVARLRDGKTVSEPCYTFPEFDAFGKIIGIARRFHDRGKGFILGGHRGLIMPQGWYDRQGPILLPEGASDCLALTAMGISGVGRPSNLGGLNHLIQLLKDFPLEREIIVLGEVDPNPKTGEWAGRKGAIKTAEKLAAGLGRPVYWGFPPDGAKDIRAWAISQNLEQNIADAWQDAGEKFLGSVQANKELAASQDQERSAETLPVREYKLTMIDSATFAAADYRQEWLIQNMLVRHQAAMLGGPRKNLKTSVICDMAISLGTETPFLGEFRVYKPVRVAVLSGESGEYVLRETALRICKAKGIGLAAANVFWGFSLPQLANVMDLRELSRALKDNGIDVLFIDPAYLCLLSGQQGLQASSLFDVGPILLALAEICKTAGCTLILVHHARKNLSDPYQPLELEDLSHAGFQEFARQWILLSRREPFVLGTGEHKLWLSSGGSAGHSGLWGLDVNEGILADDFTGRVWQVQVIAAGDIRRNEAEEKQAEKKRKEQEKNNDDETRLLAALDAIAKDGEAVTIKAVRDSSGMNSGKAGPAVTRLKAAGIIEEAPAMVPTGPGGKGQRMVPGIRRKREPGQNRDFPVCPDSPEKGEQNRDTPLIEGVPVPVLLPDNPANENGPYGGNSCPGSPSPKKKKRNRRGKKK